MTAEPGARTHHPAEHEHRDDTGTGVLRAGVFGASDGLVSNLALVMGVAGGSGHDPDTVVIAGTAGLLAGALSMAAGEYVSMATQRESMQRQLELERRHIEVYPEEEEQQLVELLQQSGVAVETASHLARQIHARVGPAADFHALLEMGITASQMGFPLRAAVVSFLAFVVGAAIPLVPWLLAANAAAWSMGVSALALLVVGGSVTTVTNRSVVVGALRQLAFGASAAGATWLIGRLVGASL